LGTSTTAEAKEYFKQMKSTDFVTDDKSTDAMDLHSTRSEPTTGSLG
jgi:hypothetical protein